MVKIKMFQFAYNVIKIKFILIFFLFLHYNQAFSFVVNCDFNDGSFCNFVHGAYWSIQQNGGIGNSPAARLQYSVSGTAGKNLGINVSSLQSNEFYFEFDVRIEGNPSGGSKFVKLFADQSSTKNNMTLIMDYIANTQARVEYYGDNACASHYIGTDTCNATIVAYSEPIDMRDGLWGHYKARVKRADPGISNGEVKVWWNGTLRMHVTGMNSNPPSNFDPTPGFEWLELGGYNNETYFNGTPWYLWIDNLKIYTNVSIIKSSTGNPLIINGTYYVSPK